MYLDNITQFLPYAIAGLGMAYEFWHFLLRPYLEGKKPFPDLPMVPGSHWLTGHTHLLQGNIDQTQKKIVEAGDVLGRSGYWTGSKKWISVSRWEDARAVLNSESWKEPNPIAKRILGILIPKTIFIQNGKEWKHNRGAINKALTPAGLEASTDAMVQVTETVTSTLKERIASEDSGCYEGEIEPIMKMVTFDVFGKATFSSDFKCTETFSKTDFVAAFDCLSSKNPDVKNAKKTIQEYVEDMIDGRRSDDGVKKTNDLLSHMIAANKKYGGDDETLRDVAISTLFAGYDTTSITLTYALCMLSKHPDAADNCLKEIERVGSIKDFNELVYCKAVITETLRLYSPIAATSRTVKKPVKLDDGYIIPADTSVCIPIFSLHREEKNFPQPLEFLPERWVRPDVGEDGAAIRWVERDPTKEIDSDPDFVPAGNPKSLFMFSAGGRNCPGLKFAQQEAVIVLAGLMKEFKFETMSPDYEVKVERQNFIQHPADRMPMKVTTRTANPQQ